MRSKMPKFWWEGEKGWQELEKWLNLGRCMVQKSPVGLKQGYGIASQNPPTL